MDQNNQKETSNTQNINEDNDDYCEGCGRECDGCCNKGKVVSVDEQVDLIIKVLMSNSKSLFINF